MTLTVLSKSSVFAAKASPLPPWRRLCFYFIWGIFCKAVMIRPEKCRETKRNMGMILCRYSDIFFRMIYKLRMIFLCQLTRIEFFLDKKIICKLYYDFLKSLICLTIYILAILHGEKKHYLDIKYH